MATRSFLLKLILCLNILHQIYLYPDCATIDKSVIASSIYARTTSSSYAPIVSFSANSNSLQYSVKLNPSDLSSLTEGLEVLVLIYDKNEEGGSYRNNNGVWAWEKTLIISEDDCEPYESSYYRMMRCIVVVYTLLDCLEENGERGNLANIFDKQTLNLYLPFYLNDTRYFNYTSTPFYDDVIIRISPCNPREESTTDSDCYVSNVITIGNMDATNSLNSTALIRFGDTIKVDIDIIISYPTESGLNIPEAIDINSIRHSIIYEITYNDTPDVVNLYVLDIINGNMYSKILFIFNKSVTNSGYQFTTSMNMTGGVFDFENFNEYIFDLNTEEERVKLFIEFRISIELTSFSVYSSNNRRLQEASESQSASKKFAFIIGNFDNDSLNEFLSELRQSLNLDDLGNTNEGESQNHNKTVIILLATVLTFFGVLTIIIVLVCLLRRRKKEKEEPHDKPVNCDNSDLGSRSRDLSDNRIHDVSGQI